MKYQLPFEQNHLNDKQKEKIIAMDRQPSQYIDDQGRQVDNKRAEFDSRYTYYQKQRRLLNAVEEQLTDMNEVDQQQYLETYNNVKKSEAEIKNLEKEILDMLDEPVDQNEEDKRKEKAKSFVNSGMDPRPGKTANYSSNRGRAPRKTLPLVGDQAQQQEVQEDQNQNQRLRTRRNMH